MTFHQPKTNVKGFYLLLQEQLHFTLALKEPKIQNVAMLYSFNALELFSTHYLDCIKSKLVKLALNLTKDSTLFGDRKTDSVAYLWRDQWEEGRGMRKVWDVIRGVPDVEEDGLM